MVAWPFRLDTTSTWLPSAPMANRPIPFWPNWVRSAMPGGGLIGVRPSFDSVAMVNQESSKVWRSIPMPSSVTARRL